MTLLVKGDFAKLAREAAKVRQVANGSLLERLSSVLGAASVSQVQQTFRDSVDPYGASWAPLLHRAGKPLLDTGRLRSSFSYQPQGKGWSVSSNVAYAGAHQYGVDKVVSRKSRSVVRRARSGPGRMKITARPMLPSAGRGLGPIWTKALNAAAARFLARALKG